MRIPAVLLLFTLAAVALAAEPLQPYEWHTEARVVAIGDLHGHYDQMVALLRGTGLVDERLDWSGGRQHLVFCGDLIDRGTDDRAVLDLARQLQQQAPAVGGRVHVLLGNHEVMNLTRDFRFVARESFADFASDETDKERQQGLNAYRMALGGGGRIADARRAFDERFPPGFFAWARAFALDGEYGSWLIEQPTVVKVNGVVYLHGGLTEEVAALGLAEINRRMVAGIRAFADASGRLEPAAGSPAEFHSLVRTARELEKRSRKAATPAARAARDLLAAYEGLPFVTDGPVWYRGSSIESERLELQRIDRVLGLLDARAQVVGHTVTRTGRITSRFNARYFRSDVGMGYGRPGMALSSTPEGFEVFNPASGSYSLAPGEPPQGEGWPVGEEELADEVVERFLRSAPIKSILRQEYQGLPVWILELEGRGMHLRAYFGVSQETAEEAAAQGRRARRRYQHLAAAYRIDRLLELDLVPVTVLREVEGREGIVQIFIHSALDQRLLDEYQDWGLLRGLDSQIAEAEAFSALLGVEERLDAGRMLLPDSRRILLADNGIAFPLSAEVGPLMPNGCGPVGADFLAALGSLERRSVASRVDGLVSEDQIAALMARRKALVELCREPEADWTIDKVIERITNRPPPPDPPTR